MRDVYARLIDRATTRGSLRPANKTLVGFPSVSPRKNSRNAEEEGLDAVQEAKGEKEFGSTWRLRGGPGAQRFSAPQEIGTALVEREQTDSVPRDARRKKHEFSPIRGESNGGFLARVRLTWHASRRPWLLKNIPVHPVTLFPSPVGAQRGAQDRGDVDGGAWRTANSTPRKPQELGDPAV